MVVEMEVCLPDAKRGDVFTRRKYLPEKAGPLKADVADIECVEDPGPLGVAEA
jgi:hypothetical protein